MTLTLWVDWLSPKGIKVPCDAFVEFNCQMSNDMLLRFFA